MIQLDFDADTPAQALTQRPVEAGFSQHSSAERAAWDDPKLELAGGTHPVVYPAAGSQANYYGSRLYLMRSDAEGVGCDDTRGPSRTISPAIRTVPSDPAAAGAVPVARVRRPLGREARRLLQRSGRAEPDPAGPGRSPGRRTAGGARASPSPRAAWSGPTRRTSSAAASSADRGCCARSRSTPAHRAGRVGGSSCCCSGRSRAPAGSRPPRCPLEARRAWGQLIAAGARAFAAGRALFVGIGLLFIPLGLVTSALQWLLFRVTALASAGRRGRGAQRVR